MYEYSSVAILVASEMLRQSISQNRADTVVVNETQSLTKVSGVEPVTSSQTALFCPESEKIVRKLTQVVQVVKFCR